MILKWAIAAVLIANGVPVQRHLFIFDPDQMKTLAECETVIEEVRAGIKQQKPEAVLIARCIDIEYVPPPKTQPQDKKSEITS